MTSSLTEAQRLKFGLLAEGLAITDSAAAVLRDYNGDRSLTPADYASTSGVILQLDDDVWVNAPIEQHNPNFVGSTRYRLEFDMGSFVVHGDGLVSSASFWLQPQYHGTTNTHGPLNNYVVTHGDRARLSPVRGCAMTCTFCNIPYDDPITDYQMKSIEAIVAAAETALNDPWQPARHLLISGGTPKPRDIPYLQAVYQRVLEVFPDVALDIMMVPLKGLLDVPALKSLGVNELSINIEIFNRSRAFEMMRNKYNQGINYYLDFIGDAAEILGPGRVRSMLMVGLEPIEDTLRGVEAIVSRGAIPVLSPFRPDPATPLKSMPPPSAIELEETFLRANDIAHGASSFLGPDCPPCSHNTLNFATTTRGGPAYRYVPPSMI